MAEIQINKNIIEIKKHWANDCYQGGDNNRLLLYGRGGYTILGQEDSDVQNRRVSHDENEIIMKEGKSSPSFKEALINVFREECFHDEY